MDTTGKIVELEKYRQREQRQRRQKAVPKVPSPSPDRAVKEMAYYMLKALECAKSLL